MVQRAQSTLRDGITQVVNEQPLVVAMAGLAAGAALASVLRPTEFEKEALRPVGEQVVELRPTLAISSRKQPPPPARR